ncbi:glutamate racemase [Sporolactobacillus laevolacticus]|uniref:Glutamate racemase n=1 Tax=Sporolactobacillus laevolacticus DSM 442 TaxID=1395513 RepID=V6IVX9_9BACL|nr:glutamate racemase [Sporolactobacillus laevolacticus]EST11315.1 glutamate racemase [Sporolactobacillus laevolacticus DSM 442]
MKIAFFDSGIGGLTVLHQAMKILPNEDYLFYADTAHVPYGEKPKEMVKKYVLEAADFLAAQDIKALVVACNTATSIAIEDLRKIYSFPILGIEPAVKPAIQQSEKKRKKVLVLATRLTLKEEKYHHLVECIDKYDIVDGLPLPGLVTLAEQYNFHEDQVVPYLKEQLMPFDLNQYGTVVLGCTHFPFFKDSVKKLFPDETDIIDGSIGTANNLKRILRERGQIGGGTGAITFYQSSVEVKDPETLGHYHEALDRLDALNK